MSLLCRCIFDNKDKKKAAFILFSFVHVKVAQQKVLRWHQQVQVSIIVISRFPSCICVRWKNNENEGLHHCAAELLHTVEQEMVADLPLEIFWNNLCLKIKTATYSWHKKSLTKIKLLRCSDRPIFQQPEQRKCVSAVATQRQHKPAHVHVLQRLL